MLGKWRATSNVREVLQEIRDALLASHPGSPAAAETYAGLRQQISALTTNRRRHLVHLARLSAATPDSIPALLEELRAEENLTEEWDGPPEWYATPDPPPTPESTLVIRTPAYIVRNDNNEPTVIRKGTGEWRASV